MFRSKLLASVSLVLAAVQSCALPEDAVGTAGELVEARFSVSVAGASPYVKSILPEGEIENKVTQVALVSYDSMGRRIDRQFYEGDLSDMILYVNNKGRNGVYVLVNMGDMRDSFPLSEEDVADMRWDIPGYEHVETYGIPMCGKVEDFRFSVGLMETVRVERMFAKLKVRVLHKNMKGAGEGAVARNLMNRSLYVRQANGRMMPFAEDRSRAVVPADLLDQSDYNPDMNDRDACEASLTESELALGPGFSQDTTFVFYVPENVQGVLLPDNSDPFEKVHESIMTLEGGPYSDICTYLELNAQRVGGLGYSGNVSYRCYLGTDGTSDFSIERNNIYEITLDLSEKGLFLDNWKVLRGEDWSDTRRLRFLEEPYVAYIGETEEIVVHYHRYAEAASSIFYPDEWYISYDEELMEKMGLALDVDKSSLRAGEDGSLNFRMNLTASEEAVEGNVLPLSVYSWDGSLSDHTVVNVARLGEMSAAWDFRPEYVSQYGILDVSGVPDALKPLKITVSDSQIIRYEALDDDSFRIVAVGVGDAVMEISNSNGSRSVSVNLSVSAPNLWVSAAVPRVNPDGTPTRLDYVYRLPSGELLSNVDEEAYRDLLVPVIDGDGYFSADDAGDYLDLYVSRLYLDDAPLSVPGQYPLYFRGKGCPEARSLGYIIGVEDPFAEVDSNHHYGSIDDCSLIGLPETPEDVRRLFAEEVSLSGAYVFDTPEIDASDGCVEMEISPQWEGEFSYGNEAYSLGYNPDSPFSLTGVVMEITQNELDASAQHSVGRHKVMTYVRNRHSGERIGRESGTLDVYVHTVVAMGGEYGCTSGDFDAGMGETFAQLYNAMAGSSVYASGPGLIHFVDVSAEYLTPVGGVLLFNRMVDFVQRSQDRLDALSMLTPSVEHGHLDPFKDLLYSVDGTGGLMTIVAGEPVGPRKGIGTVLYRMLSSKQTDAPLTGDQQKAVFYGYDNQNDHVSRVYSPCVDFHDLNVDTDPVYNKVRRTEPFYFSPSQFREYRDAEGKGYHVIHFIEEKLPLTYGWRNLM